MAVHVFLAGVGVLGPILLYPQRRAGRLTPQQMLTIGIICGAACGAGIALGARFQNTTSNIHSGHSFEYAVAAASEWLTLAVAGAAVGAPIGTLLALRALSWRPAVALFLVFAFAAGAGWYVAAARPTIDCDDDNTGFCEERYG